MFPLLFSLFLIDLTKVSKEIEMKFVGVFHDSIKTIILL